MNTIALVGNPNSGKTTLFNALTGSNQHVGNWPGVTVEKKEGKIEYKGKEYKIVDLPGTYSLGAHSEDEVIARDFILKGNPDIVINVVDATNIERNLYLTTQLMEMDVKVVLALNMMDEAKSHNIQIDINKLSHALGIPIVATVASKKIGIEELIENSIRAIEDSKPREQISYYEGDIAEKINNVKSYLKGAYLDYPTDWVAIKLLEGDNEIINHVREHSPDKLENKVLEISGDLEECELQIISNRYDFISNIVKESIVKPSEYKETLTDKIDKIVTHKIWGLPIFAVIMFVIFQLTFAIGEDVLGEFLEDIVELIGENIGLFLESISAPKMLTSFLVEGIFGGLEEIVEFIPIIVVLYFFLGILEDTGYMARAAYVMDGIMRKLGLHGQSFISMIVGFGCNVPGIMATRTLENKKDRMIAILINPFMSCGGKVPIYMLFISVFFPNHGGTALFLIYTLGIVLALVFGRIFSSILFKGENSDFIMELPPYRLPALGNVLRNMWDKVWDFLHRAGTVILAVVAFLWVLAVLPLGVDPYSQMSVLGRIGSFMAPLFKPAGFGTWQVAVSLFSGIAAKEAVVATLGSVAKASTGSLNVMLSTMFTPLSAASFMVMILLYTPCIATVATVKRETNSYGWAAFSAIYTFVIGWIMAVLVYQVGLLLGF